MWDYTKYNNEEDQQNLMGKKFLNFLKIWFCDLRKMPHSTDPCVKTIE